MWPISCRMMCSWWKRLVRCSTNTWSATSVAIHMPQAFKPEDVGRSSGCTCSGRPRWAEITWHSASTENRSTVAYWSAIARSRRCLLTVSASSVGSAGHRWYGARAAASVIGFVELLQLPGPFHQLQDGLLAALGQSVGAQRDHPHALLAQAGRQLHVLAGDLVVEEVGRWAAEELGQRLQPVPGRVAPLAGAQHPQVAGGDRQPGLPPDLPGDRGVARRL